MKILPNLIFISLLILTGCCKLSMEDQFYIDPVEGVASDEVVLQRVESKIPYGIHIEEAKKLVELNFPIEGDREWQTFTPAERNISFSHDREEFILSKDVFAYIWKKPSNQCRHLTLRGFKLRMFFDESDKLRNMSIHRMSK